MTMIVIILAVIGLVTVASSVINAYRAKREMDKINGGSKPVPPSFIGTPNP